MENRNLNIPNVTVDSLVEILSTLYTKVVENNAPLKQVPTAFLWGPAGIGKSQGVYQIAQKVEKETGKKVVVTDVRLLLFNPIDLRGMPTVNQDKTLAVWLKPAIFNMNDDTKVINMLFLDELSAVPQSVQAAAYQICLDHKVGEHKLPDNCIVIAAGNRTTDQSVSFKMPKALCNRLMHFNVETNYKAWFKWAVAQDIDSRIIGYLAFDNSKLCVEPESSDMAYTTPRSWSYVDWIIKNVGGDLESMHQLISACVGTDTALEFEAWAKSHTELPNVDDVLNGRSTKYPGSYDALLAFTASIVAAIRARREYITVSELENVCAYIKKFPTDFAMAVYSDLNSMEGVRLKLMKCPSCQAWLTKNKNLI